MKANNFDILRILLATIVLYSHIGILAEVSFLSNFPSTFAVKSFFVISGYLITKSYIRNDSLKSYTKSRIMRIYPLYFVVVTAAFVFGMTITDIGIKDYFSDGLRYLFFNLVFLNFIQPTLPGVFENNFYSGIVNGSLWTIKIEVLFYLLVPFIYGFLHRFASRKTLTITIFVVCTLFSIMLRYLVDAYSLPQSLNNQLPSLMPYFMAGAYFNFIKINKNTMFLSLPLIALGGYSGIEVVQPIVISMFVMFLAFFFPIIQVSKKIGDLSYGIYIWHFPVIQTLVYLGLFEHKYLGVIATSLMVFVLAFGSWHFIEKRCLHRV